MSYWNGSLSEVSFPNQSINQYSSAIPGYFLCLGECFVNLFSRWITEKKPFSSISLSYFVIVCELLRHQKNYINPLHPHSMYILHTVLSKLPEVLTRRICLTIKSFFSWLSFPSCSWPWCLFQLCKLRAKLTTVDAGHSLVVMGEDGSD